MVSRLVSVVVAGLLDAGGRARSGAHVVCNCAVGGFLSWSFIHGGDESWMSRDKSLRQTDAMVLSVQALSGQMMAPATATVATPSVIHHINNRYTFRSSFPIVHSTKPQNFDEK